MKTLTLTPACSLNKYLTMDEAFQNENGDILFTDGAFWVCFSRKDTDLLDFFYEESQTVWKSSMDI